jgi:hypothetical protein
MTVISMSTDFTIRCEAEPVKLVSASFTHDSVSDWSLSPAAS